MIIIRTQEYQNELLTILKYIANDKINHNKIRLAKIVILMRDNI